MKENIYSEILKRLEFPGRKTQEQAWNELEARLPHVQPATGRVVSISWKPWAVAAAVIALAVLTISLWPNAGRITEACPPGQHRTINLPDGSLVFLNAGSEISFRQSWSDERNVELKGEAFFEVEKGSKFTVSTPSGSVEVVGTSFNVFDRDGKFEVSCYTGKVRVSHGESENLIQPGEMTMVRENRLSVTAFDPGEGSWREGTFFYTNEPLINVLNELERQFNVTITLEGKNDRGYTGNFTNSNLEEALALVCGPMNLKWEMGKDMHIILTPLKP